jgi:RNA polymerase sigma factor (sigma-70 family)
MGRTGRAAFDALSCAGPGTAGSAEWLPRVTEHRESRERYARWFAALFDQYGAPLARLAASYARARGEQDDLFQEIMIAVWKALPAYRGDCSERTYVYRIAHNRAISYLSRRRPAVQDLDDEAELPAAAPTPEQALTRDEEAARLADAVARLPVGHREVVALVLEGLSYREIAEVLGISESNVGARLTRARTQLRAQLGGER